MSPEGEGVKRRCACETAGGYCLAGGCNPGEALNALTRVPSATFQIRTSPTQPPESRARRCRAASVAPVFLAAPNTRPDRLAAVAQASEGFVYCVSSFGVTGARDTLGGSARPVVESLRTLTRSPLLVGVGISTPDQAREACTFADGVVVGSALVKPLLAGDRKGMLELAGTFRGAISDR